MSRPSSVRRGWLAACMTLVLVMAAGPGAAYGAKPSGDTDPPRTAVTSSTAVALGVSAGNMYTCAIRADGSVGCWGYEEYGEASPPAGQFTAVSAGSVHTCAIAEGGTLVCWGTSEGGRSTPPEGTFTTLSTGVTVACAVRADGTLACWGDNDHFQATPPGGPVASVDAGSTHVCAVREDGSLVCWGNNENGRATPPAGTFTSVSAGDQHTCAIRADGSLACWGYNGQNRSIPPGGTFTSVSAGYAHACALRSDGTLACWGDNESGQAAPPAGEFTSVSAGFDHSCAIRSDDTLACWGDDSGDQVTPRPRATVGALPEWAATTELAVGWDASAALAPVTTYDVRYLKATWSNGFGSPVTWRTATAETAATLTAAPGSTYCFSARAHDADGHVSSWSEESCAAVPLDDRSLARAGTWTTGTGGGHFASTYVRSSTAGSTLTRTGVSAYWVALLATTCPTCGTVQVFLGSSTTPVRTVSLASPATVESKFIPVFDAEYLDGDPYVGSITIKVTSSGKAVTIDGLLVTPAYLSPAWADASEPPTPAAVSSAHSLIDVSAGASHTCAVEADGALTCWGSNAYGEALPPAGTFTAVSAGLIHSCAIRADGTLACWGYDGWSGLATPPDGTFSAVESGQWNSCAIRGDGTIACWGDDYVEGDLQPPAGTFTDLSTFDLRYGDSFCGLREDGTITCWGYEYEYGEAETPSGTFTSIGGSCGIRPDGTASCWGRDDLGQATPPPAATFASVSSEDLHACGILTDGTLACWGDNEYFEATPPAGTFAIVEAGAHHTCAIATDGTFACWGHDRLGQVTPRPVAAMKGLATWLTTRTVALSWRATSLDSLASYDVRYRRAAWNGGFGPYTTWRSATTATAGTFTAAAGSTYCYATRARDAAGSVSGWSAETCTGVPLDDRSLARSGSWTAGTGSAYYGSTYLRSSAKGASLTRTKVVATRLALVATTCPTCGTVKVYWNGALLKTLSLTSATTVYRKLITIKTWTSAHTGTLKITVASTGKKVIIDGVAIRRL